MNIFRRIFRPKPEPGLSLYEMSRRLDQSVAYRDLPAYHPMSSHAGIMTVWID